MITQETLTFIIAILSIGAFVFSIFLYFRKPQEKSEINDAVFDVKFKSLESLFVNLRDNHLHTLDVKLDLHIESQQKNDMMVCEKLSRIETHLENLLKK